MQNNFVSSFQNFFWVKYLIQYDFSEDDPLMGFLQSKLIKTLNRNWFILGNKESNNWIKTIRVWEDLAI